jgi:hypothetical protein
MKSEPFGLLFICGKNHVYPAVRAAEPFFSRAAPLAVSIVRIGRYPQAFLRYIMPARWKDRDAILHVL